MGLISFFKKFFAKKVIQMPTKKQDVLIQPQSSGYTEIEIGQKILVEPGWNAVIVAKDTVLDVFGEGTHEISLAYIPKTTKALGLDKGKVKKNGVTAEVVLQTKFKCDLYYVRTEFVENRHWQTSQIKVHEKGKKKFKFNAVGTYSFQVQNPDSAIKLFLIDWAKIKPGRAIQKLDVLVSEQITNILWSKKFKSIQKLTEYEFGNMILKPSVYKNFKKYGIAITNIKVDNIVYPQNFKPEEFEKVEGEVLDDNKQEQNKTDEKLKIEQQTLEIENSDNKEIGDETEVKAFLTEEETKIPINSFDDIICQKCNAKNPKNSKFCNQCGNKFDEED